MSYIIDRRLNGKHKSSVNRQRFLRRYKEHIRKAVEQAVNQRSIQDLDRGEQITIPKRDIHEPHFGHGQGGKGSIVHPGNKEFASGDRIPKPEGGQGGGSGQGNASNQGEGEDDFVFQISQEEFLDFVFEDLALPNLVRKDLKEIKEFNLKHAGVVSEGTPSKLNLVRSMRNAYARRMVMSSSSRRKLAEAEAEREALLDSASSAEEKARLVWLDEQIELLKQKIESTPFLDTYDLRYNHHIKEPRPSSKAVMFCIMDVSGSMTQETKNIAKRFFILLYLFLHRNYEKIDVVFIRHHTSAKEVTEEEFFYSRETGGTIVSSALKLMHKIVKERYSPDQWNIYAAQASDGDNWDDDSRICKQVLAEDLVDLVQYFTYIEITPRDHQSLWYAYEEVQAAHPDSFAMRHIVEVGDIYPVFRDLFQRRQHESSH
ncbi:YeaH/YhbH family protein [Marinomonas ostreistagni]|uniref:YeaH/YhbH family protein n=1 Tax=Marinomonas ostreistagni TaxID=359209 RepID=UPI00194EC884|nr:YeaH/YhbH family protein [Marinomonas ostreistagni]MBM6549682.1 YeaH/YhbH family protein [Marinomonas ostreistagni]